MTDDLRQMATEGDVVCVVVEGAGNVETNSRRDEPCGNGYFATKNPHKVQGREIISESVYYPNWLKARQELFLNTIKESE